MKQGRFNAYDEKMTHKAPKRSGSRPVLDGVSIYDLIIPWKTKTEGEISTIPVKSQKKAT